MTGTRRRFIQVTLSNYSTRIFPVGLRMYLLDYNGRSITTCDRPVDKGWMVIQVDFVVAFSLNVQEQLQRLQRALQLLREKHWLVKAQNARSS